jgi:hypothetical protein
MRVVPPAPQRVKLFPVRPAFFPFPSGRIRRFRSGFGLGFCDTLFALRISTRNFGFFRRELSCFGDPFLNPFAFGFPVAIGPPVFLAPVVASAGMADAPNALETVLASQEASPAEPDEQKQDASSPPVTLLQLKNGWMYGLVDYWLENGRLHYVTNYGGQNSVPIEEIDLDKTVQLNWERGVAFVLRPKPDNR